MFDLRLALWGIIRSLSGLKTLSNGAEDAVTDNSFRAEHTNVDICACSSTRI